MNRWLVICAMTLCFTGCGGAVKDEVQKVTVPPAVEYLKGLLQNIEKSGAELGSGAQELQDAVAKLKETDSAKADALAKPLKDLCAAKDPAKIKSAAKEMLSKLQ